MSTEKALSYAALILADSEVEITSEKLMSLVTAANLEIESIWANIFAKAMESQNLTELLVNFNTGASGAGAVAGGAAAGGAAAGEDAAEEKEEEAKEESDDDMGFGLFD
ncbi:ribosomal protein P1 SCDLUD_002647 [Saccharomycodes ludwigii]|uniref:ribosomal protein P1 n=1 Tax=Saccharomycodes ludwigii TaxID=36035 RepID=UPI001E8A4A7C|nr:hypothetical protein SCDLUD_002647 [Saccharomycodes ludwigii]KAH3901164.1 hypothetical protein SCDLUD_002647 [Saccharomycodes ludwigii]